MLGPTFGTAGDSQTPAAARSDRVPFSPKKPHPTTLPSERPEAFARGSFPPPEPMGCFRRLEGAAAILLSLSLQRPGRADAQPDATVEADFGSGEKKTAEKDLVSASKTCGEISTSVLQRPTMLSIPRSKPTLQLSPVKRRKYGSMSESETQRKSEDGETPSQKSRKVLCRICQAPFSSDSAMFGHMRHCKFAVAPVAERNTESKGSRTKKKLESARTSENDHLLECSFPMLCGSEKLGRRLRFRRIEKTHRLASAFCCDQF